MFLGTGPSSNKPAVFYAKNIKRVVIYININIFLIA